MEVESLKKLNSTVEKCIEELSKKQDLTPQETRALIDGLMAREMLNTEIEDCEAGGYKDTDEMYSERSSYLRRGSYAWNARTGGSYDNGMSGNGSYGKPMHDNRGWYQSNGQNQMMNGQSGLPSYPAQYMNQSYCDPYYYGGDMGMRGYGYSRHSVSDRAIEQLEHMMDTSESDFERQELRKYIKMIRAAGMSD